MPPRPEREVAAELEARERELLSSGQKVTGPDPTSLEGQVETLKAMVLELSSKLSAKQEGGAQPSDRQFLEGLALALRKVDDQGRPSAQRMVAPEILAARAAAREKMVDAILAARSLGIEPEYEVMNHCYLADELVEPFSPNAKLFSGAEIEIPSWKRNERTYGRTHIGWAGVPNESMKPFSDEAKEIHRHFMASIGGATAAVGEDPLTAKLNRLTSEGVQVRDRGKPQPVRILGTIADPAQQSF